MAILIYSNQNCHTAWIIVAMSLLRRLPLKFFFTCYFQWNACNCIFPWWASLHYLSSLHWCQSPFQSHCCHSCCSTHSCSSHWIECGLWTGHPGSWSDLPAWRIDQHNSRGDDSLVIQEHCDVRGTCQIIAMTLKKYHKAFKCKITDLPIKWLWL